MTYVLDNIIGKRYKDVYGRSLKVISIHPGDVYGREVRGRIKDSKDGVNAEARDFATTFKNFETIFLKKKTPSKKNRMPY